MSQNSQLRQKNLNGCSGADIGFEDSCRLIQNLEFIG